MVRWIAFAALAFFPPTTRYLDVELSWSAGQASIVSTRVGQFDKPIALRRFRGRFAARIVHDEKMLIEVPFDVPLLADAEEPSADEATHRLGERFRGGVTAKFTIRVPLPDGGKTLVIYDSKTKKTVTRALSP